MNGLLLTICLSMGYLYAFWVVYIAVMGAYRASLAGRLTGLVKWLAYPLVLVGIVMDVLANLLIAPVLFLDPPQELLVTSRLQRYKTHEPVEAWRYRVAAYICDHLLDIFDPRGDHC